MTILLFLLAGVIVNMTVTAVCELRLPDDYYNHPDRTSGATADALVALARRSLQDDSWPASEEVVRQTVHQHLEAMFSLDYEDCPQQFSYWSEVCFGAGWNVQTVQANYTIDQGHVIDGEFVSIGDEWISDLTRSVKIESAGWPRPVLHAAFIWEYKSYDTVGFIYEWVHQRAWINWPGFAVNTLFYAALLWLPFRGPFALRRHIRRKRGRCFKCGYDLRAHHPEDPCPECGWKREESAAE